MELKTVFWLAHELRTTTPTICRMAKAMGFDVVYENNVDCVRFPDSYYSSRTECQWRIEELKQTDRADKATAKQAESIRKAIQRDSVQIAKLQAEVHSLDAVLAVLADGYRITKNRAKHAVKLAELEARQKRMIENQTLLGEGASL